MRLFVVTALVLGAMVSKAEEVRIALHCTEMEPGAGYPAVVNILKKNGEDVAMVHAPSYGQPAEPKEYRLTQIDENGPETWYYGENFTLRFDPTVNEGTLLESADSAQIELFCHVR